MIYGSMQMPIGWNGLNMPTGGCSVHIPIVVISFFIYLQHICCKGHIVFPYTQGLGESIKKTCSKYDIQTHFKGIGPLKILVKPKDKDTMDKKSKAIYYCQCGELACNEEYIAETSRTFEERFKEHLKEPSPIHVHNTQKGHSTTQTAPTS